MNYQDTKNSVESNMNKILSSPDIGLRTLFIVEVVLKKEDRKSSVKASAKRRVATESVRKALSIKKQVVEDFKNAGYTEPAPKVESEFYTGLIYDNTIDYTTLTVSISTVMEVED